MSRRDRHRGGTTGGHGGKAGRGVTGEDGAGDLWDDRGSGSGGRGVMQSLLLGDEFLDHQVLQPEGVKP